MQVGCPNCAHVVTVPPEKAAVPSLKVKCRCGTVFAVATAARPDVPAASAAPRPSAPGPGPSGTAKAAPPVSDRVAAIRAANARAATPAPAASGATAVAVPAARTAAGVPPAVMIGAASAALKPPPLPPRPAGVSPGAPMRTAAAVPRPAAPPAPASAATPSTERPRSARIPWTRCQNHAQTRSEQVCPKCTKGFCDPCTQKVQNAAICPACEGLCVPFASYEQMQDKVRQRARTMMEELGVIAGYPLRDAMAFAMLALFTWFFGLFAGFAGIMVILSKGVLTWYSFNAVSKVAIGNMRDVMPEFRDLSDIANALKLSFAALAISAGPLFLCLFLIPGASMLSEWASRAPRMEVVHAQPPATPAGDDDKDDEAEPGQGARAGSKDDPEGVFAADREGRSSMLAPLALLLIVAAVGWMVGYMPVALTVAALSKSILSTLNPLIGIDTIRKMGSTYWQALGIYGAIVIAQWLLGAGFRLIPFAGGLVTSFVDAYAALAIGCTLGLAVFKKAVELGWD